VINTRFIAVVKLNVSTKKKKRKVKKIQTLKGLPTPALPRSGSKGIISALKHKLFRICILSTPVILRIIAANLE